MKNLKQLSAIALCTLFATMQISSADINTGLGASNGGAVITDPGAGFVDVTGVGTGNVGLNFDANSHVKWNTLNVDSGEALNFNAVNGANNLTILNTVNQGMTNIYGQINANSGIGHLIISNPNGVLFDGAKFTTAGDTTITTKDMSSVDINNFNPNSGSFSALKSNLWLDDNGNPDLVQVKIKDSNFSVGGEFNVFAPKIVGTNSNVNAGNTFKLVTADGYDYLLAGIDKPAENKGVTFLKAMNIDGNVEIVNNAGALSISDGTYIDGDLKAEVGGYGHILGSDTDKITVTGDADIKGHGQVLTFRDGVVDGNLKMSNDGGFVELKNMNIKGDANLTTTGFQPIEHKKYNHYVHVNGNTEVGGDLNIESSQNIHVGNYKVTQTNPGWDGQLLDGKLVVKGDLNAHTTGGHIMTTIDTSAKNINYNAEKYNDGTRDYGGNILSDGKAVLTADTYKFESDGYIGGLKSLNGVSVDKQVINTMENYTFIPADIESHDYLAINGGTITKLDTPKVSAGGNDVKVYIKSLNDVTVNGTNAGVVNMVAPDKQITITGDVHAKEFNIGDRTGTLKLDFPNRDFTTNYTSIKDKHVVTIRPDEEITYELANKPEVGYNSPDFHATDGTKTTYLIGPGAPIVPPGPTPPTPPTPPAPQNTNPTDNGENARNLMTQWVPEDVTAAPVNTPVAFAADLDEDDIYGPCRKNVDGSVTVVRAYPMAK